MSDDKNSPNTNDQDTNSFDEIVDKDFKKLCDDMEEKVLELQQQIEDKQNECEQVLRAYAESENSRKRLEKQNEEIAKFANVSFTKDLLTVADNLEMALATIPADQKNNDAIKNLILGIEMTHTGLTKIFEKNKVEKISPETGAAFDHNWHQAVSSESCEDFDDNTIVKVLQSGFKMHERILRPAMVVICKK